MLSIKLTEFWMEIHVVVLKFVCNLAVLKGWNYSGYFSTVF